MWCHSELESMLNGRGGALAPKRDLAMNIEHYLEKNRPKFSEILTRTKTYKLEIKANNLIGNSEASG